MHQKDFVRQAWTEAVLYRSKDPKIGAFLKRFEETSVDCWPELVKELRERYPEYKEQLVVPIWNTGDKLLRLNVIRSFELDRNDEVALLQELVRRSDLQQDAVELQAVVCRDHEQLLNQVAKKRGLSSELKSLALDRLPRK